jgi:hypothetical protein
VLVRSRPYEYEQSAELEHVHAIIDTYDIMGWIEVDRSDETTPVVVNVRPIYQRQSDGLRSMSIGNRQDRQMRDRAHREPEANVGGAIDAMGLTRNDDVATLIAKLRPFGIEIKIQPICFPMTSCVAVVWKPGSGSDQGYKGTGNTQSKALCRAAGYAFLASAREARA